MAIIEPNFDEVVTLEPGVYNVRLHEVEVKDTKAGDKQYLKWTLEVVGNDDPTLNGQKCFTNTMTSGKGAFALQDLYKAVTGEEIAAASFDTDSILGQEVGVILVEGTDQQGNATRFPEVKKFIKVQE